MEKQLSLSQPAPYMIMRLKEIVISSRKEKDTVTHVPTKNNAAISFPLELSLQHREANGEEETESQYKLVSFIVHKGTIGAGHYTAYININNIWYYFDDAKPAAPQSAEEIAFIASLGHCFDKDTTPVIFFYEAK